MSRVKQAVVRIQQTLPEGARLNVFYDRTSLLQACVATVVDALLECGLFVVLVLFLFVAELRTALIVVFSLPLTFLISFVVMRWAGVSSNLMSLGGLAFSVGMVVDASIVVEENVRRHLAQRTDRAQRRPVVAEAALRRRSLRRPTPSRDRPAPESVIDFARKYAAIGWGSHLREDF